MGQNQRSETMNTWSDAEALYKNRFISTGFGQVTNAQSLDFRQFRDKQLQAEAPTERVQPPKTPANSLARRRLIQTAETNWQINIDSRDRDKSAYPDASSFTIYLGSTFENVVRLQVLSIEFPNVANVINPSNNVISWINEEDEDLGYPVYSVTIPPGSYSYASLQETLNRLMHSANVKRRGGTGAPHYFIVTLDQNTDKVSFTSIVAQETQENPIQVTLNSNVITFFAPGHGFETGDQVWVLNALGPIAGITTDELNGVFTITAVSPDIFSYEVASQARGPTSVMQGGGKTVEIGKEAPFQFLFRSQPRNLADNLGFPLEDSALRVPQAYLQTLTLPVTGVIPGYPMQIVSFRHGLEAGDRVFLENFQVVPSVYASDQHRGEFIVTGVPSPDIFQVDFTCSWVSDVSSAIVYTRVVTAYVPSHGFNSVFSLSQAAADQLQLQTFLPHNKSVGQELWIDSPGYIAGSFLVTSVLDADLLQATPKLRLAGGQAILSAALDSTTGLTLVTTEASHGLSTGQTVVVEPYSLSVPLSVSSYVVQQTFNPTAFYLQAQGPLGAFNAPGQGLDGMLLRDRHFYLSNVEPLGGLDAQDLNMMRFEVREILDENTFTFSTLTGYASLTDIGGGSAIRMNSLQLGWRGTQTNEDATGAVYKPIDLSADNYCFLTVPSLGKHSTMRNTGTVQNILSKVQLTAQPVTVLFNTAVSGAFEFNTGPVDRLDSVDFLWVDPSGNRLDFGYFDWSCTLQITTLDSYDELNWQPARVWVPDPLLQLEGHEPKTKQA
jgi:hypothetical protein